MIDWAKFRWEQYQIERWIDRISREQRDAEEKARAKGATAQELHDLGHDFFFQRKLADDEMIRLTSNYYVRLAHRMLIPVPEFKTEGGAWMESDELASPRISGHFR